MELKEALVFVKRKQQKHVFLMDSHLLYLSFLNMLVCGEFERHFFLTCVLRLQLIIIS